MDTSADVLKELVVSWWWNWINSSARRVVETRRAGIVAKFAGKSRIVESPISSFSGEFGRERKKRKKRGEEGEALNSIIEEGSEGYEGGEKKVAR